MMIGAPTRYVVADLPWEISCRIVVNPVTWCWEWQGERSDQGYGRVGWRGESYMIHRLVYQLMVGPIPEDKPELDHVKAWGCRSTACCWPLHLEPVMKDENLRRRGPRTCYRRAPQPRWRAQRVVPAPRRSVTVPPARHLDQDERRRRVGDALGLSPDGISAASLGEWLSFGKTTTWRYLVSLQDEGLAELRGMGRTARWHAVHPGPREGASEEGNNDPEGRPLIRAPVNDSESFTAESFRPPAGERSPCP